MQLVGGVEKRDLVLADYDTHWPEKCAAHERCIHAALGSAAVQVDHIGSASVPGLAAKPIIDIQVTHMRAEPDDRDLYERTKRALINHDWPDMNAYTEAKTEVIVEIKERATRHPQCGTGACGTN